MAHQENAAVAGSEQSGTAPRAPYERPILTELSVSATLSGDPNFPTEGTFRAAGSSEDQEVGPGSS
jgi:hypothetical protein